MFIKSSSREQLMKTLYIPCLISFLAIALLPFVVNAEQTISGEVFIQDRNNEQIKIYDGSYALLIGVSRYDDSGWNDLDSIPRELKSVKKALESHGFTVIYDEKKKEYTANDIRSTFQDFINHYGYNTNNRLLFIYSGHGHTWEEGNQGYLVPSDAPVPITPKGHPGASFLSKAFHISQMLEWSRQMTVRHALFLFDSCFSGTIFSSRKASTAPEAKRLSVHSIMRPARHMI
jgi:hypothetical protein